MALPAARERFANWLEKSRAGRAGFVVLSAAFFALCNVLVSFVPIMKNYQIRPQTAIPLLAGYFAGPGAGFMAGFAGNLASDAVMGFEMLRYAASFSVCNGLYGFLMGFFGKRRPRFDGPESLGGLYSAMLLIVSAGALYAAFVEWLAFGADLVSEFERLCVSVVVSDYLSAAMLVPCSLWVAGRIRRTIGQRYTLLLYYVSFVLTIGSVVSVLSLLSLKFGFTDPWTGSYAYLFMYDVLIVPVAAVTLIGALASSSLTRIIVKPLSDLSREIKLISAGGFSDRLKVDFGEDLRDLSDSFNEMTDRLAVYSIEIQNSAAREERARTELRVASKIQAMLLPDGEGIRAAGCEAAGRMVPMKEIGGDFFSYFPLDDGGDEDGRFFFVVADVSGHGVPAALFTMAVGMALDSLAHVEPDIGKIFTTLNAHLCGRNRENYFVTAFAGIFDASSRTLRYVNAGHPPPYLRSKGSGFRALPGEPGIVLGAFSGVEYEARDAVVPAGDVLCVYTDGVTEALNEKTEMYSAKRLVQILDEAGSGIEPAAPADIVERVFIDLKNFTRGLEPSDDVTVLCVRF
jgi:serine phosphatase RsbU (regulator of sigma subunit)